MSLINEFVTEIEINNNKVQVSVVIDVEEDVEFDLTDWDDARDITRIKSGGLFVAYVRVTAKALGMEGIDSLGQCTLRPNNMFNSEPFETDLKMYLNEYQMIDNALEDLKTNLVNQAKLLKQYA